MKDLSLLTYDEILELLDEIEFGGLEERSNFEELENINRFLATLAIEGAQDNDTALEDDVIDLISTGNRSCMNILNPLKNSQWRNMILLSVRRQENLVLI